MFANSLHRGSLAAIALFFAPHVAQAQTLGAQTRLGPQQPAGERIGLAPYRMLDNDQGPWINLNVVPIRPMAITNNQFDVYAVNTHDSVVQHFGNLAGQPTETFRVPWGPVSIAIWPQSSQAELLVVCRGNHVLARLDRLSGETLSILQLPFEPADILVNHTTDRAFIACSGDDSVVEVDLLTDTIVHTYRLPSKHPVFLAFDADPNHVLVAPMFSGNNSLALSSGTSVQAVSNVIDLETSNLVVSGLPDEDLFRLDTLNKTVEPVLKDTGTVLFAFGINPASGDFWQLNTEANNKDETKQSEPAINGFAVTNRLTITSLPIPGDPPNDAHTILDLDDTDRATQTVDYDPALSIGQPYSLEFTPGGSALITGLLTDNVTALDANGDFLTEFDLADGSIPRQTLRWGNASVFVYCWGTNRIEMWSLDQISGWSQLAVLDLGFDPAPPFVQQGRAVFYDASHSLNNNQSCASCHIEGRTDMALWNLSDQPLDDKGPMVSQTLASIDETEPLHWRGERHKLIDFNGAFAGLLGGTPLDTDPGQEFEQFRAFVRSIQSTANPHQDRRRLVSEAIDVPIPGDYPVQTASAVRGQDLYFDVNTDGQSCNFCHTLPTGSSNDIIAEGRADPFPGRTSIEVAHFKELWRKQQDLVPVEFVGNVTVDYPLLGSGLTHAGLGENLFTFIDTLFNISDQDTADIFAFVFSLDQGLAPLVHEAELLNQQTLPVAHDELIGFFKPQADEGHIDLVAYGSLDLGLGRFESSWYYDRSDELFHAADSLLAPRSLRSLLALAQAGSANLTFLGLPLGSGKRFAADADGDELVDADELRLGTLPLDPHSDSDEYPDGYEVIHGSDPLDGSSVPFETESPQIRNLKLQWVTGRLAKVSFETDEPTTFVIDYQTSFGPQHVVRGEEPRRVHSAILTELLPSTMSGVQFTYTGLLSVFDLSDNKNDAALPSFETPFQIEVPLEVTLGGLDWTVLVSGAQVGSLVAQAEARVQEKINGPPFAAQEDYVVVATVVVNGVQSTSFTSPNPTSILVQGAPPVFPGPFVISDATGTDGLARLDFTQPGLLQGDEVLLNIVAVIPIVPGEYDPQNPDFGNQTNIVFPLSLWDLPTTLKEFRKVSTRF